MRAAWAALLSSLAGTTLASDFSLSVPVDCTLGRDCHIQQYMDRDPGPGARDFTCGPLSYDGHKGTDFALPTLRDLDRGVTVLAAAPGRVTGLRDGMDDGVMTPDRTAELDGRDCGNGVVIDHGGGWVTQYCHLAKGSVRVAKGDTVARGAPLGQIGLSGRTEFPHLHLSVRKDGVPVDPFAVADTEGCDPAPADGLWDPALPYRAGGLTDAGFADALPEYQAVLAGTADRPIAGGSPAIVLFALLYGAREGDLLSMSINGPRGQIASQDITLDKTQARVFRAIGRRARGAWPAGSYNGVIALRRGADTLDTRRVTFTLR